MDSNTAFNLFMDSALNEQTKEGLIKLIKDSAKKGIPKIVLDNKSNAECIAIQHYLSEWGYVVEIPKFMELQNESHNIKIYLNSFVRSFYAY